MRGPTLRARTLCGETFHARQAPPAIRKPTQRSLLGVVRQSPIANEWQLQYNGHGLRRTVCGADYREEFKVQSVCKSCAVLGMLVGAILAGASGPSEAAKRFFTIGRSSPRAV